MSSSYAPWPVFAEDEIEAVARVLRSGKVNYWTGEEGRAFEREFADFAGTRHAIAVANGTVALDLALHGLGIGARNGGRETDEVVVTPRSFIASVSCVVNAGARPVFADVDPDSGNITPETVAPCIGPRTRAIICVHLAGWPCDMDGFRNLVAGRDIALIEDCAQAHGARYRGRPVGGLGDVAAWSFCQDKIMTTGGEGGMVTCNDDDLWRRMWSYKDHGKSWAAVYERAHPPGFRWLHESFGTNWRMTEMQAAIGRIQLRKLPGWVEARNRNATFLANVLLRFADPDGPIRLPKFGCLRCKKERGSDTCCRNAYYKFYAYVQQDNLSDGWTRDRIVESISSRRVPCFQGSCSEIYLEKAFKATGLRPERRLRVARQLGETSLMFLVHPGISEDDLQRTKSVIDEVLQAASLSQTNTPA
jgi:dTDP-4-amino-4,6-dideoxygalactose transaminase